MTEQAILLRLLEEAQKYQYDNIQVYAHTYSWVPIDKFKPGTKLELGSYRNGNSAYTTGYILRLEGVVIEKEALAKFTSIDYEARLTIDKLTIIYQKEYKTMFLCYENKI